MSIYLTEIKYDRNVYMCDLVIPFSHISYVVNIPNNLAFLSIDAFLYTKKVQ